QSGNIAELARAWMERITTNNRMLFAMAHTTAAKINTRKEATYTFFVVASLSE
ncbi:24411_t:CDS:1, partial [Gigaspora rosea]